MASIRPITLARKQLANPVKWNPGFNEGHLLVSRAYIYPGNWGIGGCDAPAPQVFPGVENIWILNNDLPIKDKTMLQQDPDRDGFNNFEEYQGKSNPNDARSKPEFAKMLVLEGIKEAPLKLRLPQGKEIDVSTMEHTKWLNEVRSQGYEYFSFHEILEPQANGILKDKSQYLFRQLATGKIIMVTAGERFHTDNDIAIISFTWNGTTARSEKKVGDTFSLTPELNVGYKVTGITMKGALITRVADHQVFLVKTAPKTESPSPPITD